MCASWSVNSCCRALEFWRRIEVDLDAALEVEDGRSVGIVDTRLGSIGIRESEGRGAPSVGVSGASVGAEGDFGGSAIIGIGIVGSIASGRRSVGVVLALTDCKKSSISLSESRVCWVLSDDPWDCSTFLDNFLANLTC